MRKFNLKNSAHRAVPGFSDKRKKGCLPLPAKSKPFLFSIVSCDYGLLNGKIRDDANQCKDYNDHDISDRFACLIRIVKLHILNLCRVT